MTTLRARTVFSSEDFTVTAIESLDFQVGRPDRGRYAVGSLKPIAVIVNEQGRTWALDMDAQPLDTDEIDLPAGFEPG